MSKNPPLAFVSREEEEQRTQRSPPSQSGSAAMRVGRIIMTMNADSRRLYRYRRTEGWTTARRRDSENDIDSNNKNHPPQRTSYDTARPPPHRVRYFAAAARLLTTHERAESKPKHAYIFRTNDDTTNKIARRTKYPLGRKKRPARPTMTNNRGTNEVTARSGRTKAGGTAEHD